MATSEELPLHQFGRSQWILGYAAILFVVAIWASFALSVRAIHGAGLSESDLALIRYGIPSIGLAPFFLREWPRFRRMKLLDASLIVCGGGLPFFFIVASAGSESSAAVVGSMVTGTLPVTVVLAAWLIEKRTPERKDILPATIVLAGVCLLILPQVIIAPSDTLTAAAMLLVAGGLWAGYTVGLKRAGLSSVGCAILLCMPSTLVLMVLFFFGLADIGFDRLLSVQAIPFIASQGVGAGLMAGLAYPFAISRIGGVNAALFGSLTPAVTCLAAWGLLGETPSLSTLLGVSGITMGVAIGNLARARKMEQSAIRRD